MYRALLLCLVVFFTISAAVGQECLPPKIVANNNSENLFTEEQEMILGELTLQRLSSEFRPIRDAELLAYLENLGNKLVKHLPPTDLKFTFHIVDYPDANAFNIPGGHVFVTRKLIAFANSEDEIAFVVGHELGHAIVRHGSQDLSYQMRQILNVKSVGDRRDIVDKYNRLIENFRTKSIKQRSNHEGEQQLEADRIGFFAAVAAGYDPNASFTFFDRLTESKGKTGNWFSDLFGSIKPAEKRLREISKVTATLPAACREGRSPRADEDFTKWQATSLNYRRTNRSPIVPGLIRKTELGPKLRTDISKIEFSRDGKYLYAVDDFSITVVEREGLKSLFQVPADGISKAHFTPDGNELVFLTRDLRFERWNIKSAAPVAIREVILRRDCLEYDLTTSGRHVACVDQEANIRIIDTRNGSVVWEKKKFYELSVFEIASWFTSITINDDGLEASFFRISFSPDSQYALFSRSNKFRFSFKIDGFTAAASENKAVAVDLNAMKEVNLGGDIKKIAARPHAFVEGNRIVGSTEAKLDAGGLFSFPDGKRVQRFEFGGEMIETTASKNFLTIKPMQTTRLGVFDVSRNAIVTGLNKSDVAIWNNIMALESVDGSIILREMEMSADGKEMKGTNIGTLELPVSPLRSLRSINVSNDLRWVALSTRTRGALWDLNNGERKIFTRSFQGSVVDDQGNAVADFPAMRDTKRTLALLRADVNETQPIMELPDAGVQQYDRFLLRRNTLKEKPAKRNEKDPRNTFGLSAQREAEIELSTDAKLEIYDWLQKKSIWSRDFKGRVPRYNFHSYSGRLILYWALSSNEGKARIKDDPKLRASADALESKDGNIMIEVIDAYDEKKNAFLFVDTGRGSIRPSRGQSERDWLAVYDSTGRVLVYSLATGELKHRFFGTYMALNPTLDYIAVENFPGEVAVYDLKNGERVADLETDTEVTFARFDLSGTKLFLMTESQTTYEIDVKKLLATPRETVP